MSVTPILQLPGSGQKIPQVGFGLWKVPADQAADIVYEAIKVGYRLFDGAYDYGNEKEAGQGILRAIKDGLVKREDIFVTSKLWNSCHQRDRAIKVGTEQVTDWGLGYIDLYMIHFPIAIAYNPGCTRGWYYDGKSVLKTEPIPMRETWEALEYLHSKGLVKNIGLSNCNAQTIYDIFTYAKVRPCMLQIEHHPYLTQLDLIDMCKDANIMVTAYSSFGPQSFFELPPSFPTKAIGCPVLFDTDIVKSLAAKYKKTGGQVLLRWATQRGLCVIPKSSNPKRLLENLSVCDFDMEEKDIKSISDLDLGMKFNDPGTYLIGSPLRLFA